MFQNQELKDHLQSSFTIESQSALIAEWNMNVPGNILKLGNYRYRKSSSSIYSALPNFFDMIDSGNFYTGATDANITVESGLLPDAATPLLFTYSKDKEKIYYSLEDCIKPFRPRSGINKLSYFSGCYVPHTHKDMFRRPRYYMPHRDDEFKYWRSYRTEASLPASQITTLSIQANNFEFGISKNNSNGIYEIDDAVPFVVYKEEVPANRIVIKVQTNVGDLDMGPFKSSANTSFSDPFFGNTNKTVPQNFKIEYLDTSNQWIPAYEFNQESLRDDGTAIFGTDGYLSLEYGLQVPTQYINNFMLVGTTTSIDSLPSDNITGYAYLVVDTVNTKGMLHIWNGASYDILVPQYSWNIGTDGTYENTHFVTNFTNPQYFNETNDARNIYREFVWVKGLRLVVESMNKSNCPLELIEISPRLCSNLSESLIDFGITKILSNLTSSSLPVGELSVSNGHIKLFDEYSSFNINNVWNGTSGSIISKYVQKNIKFVFYEIIKNVNGSNYYVPIKTMYSEGMPQSDDGTSTITINVRDFYFYLESIKAPQILLTEVSLSQAVCILLDSVGFSNYVFKRLDTENDPIIPYFFIPPEKSVAEILNQLAVATQSAMFFDEYNNFVVMSKGYLLDESTRAIDLTLYGSNNPYMDGINENVHTTPLPNIVEIASKDQKVYNSGNINYTARYIQRSYGSLKQSSLVDNEKTWIYKPVLLWEVSGTEATKSLNNAKQEKYVLGAMPLNSDISDQLPTVVNRSIINNIFDFGENIYYITRFQGYFYANGEIIRYDAVEYNVTGIGNVWITSNLEYQNYFSKVPFNGKIYPTGSVRIYVEPYYETIDGILKMKNGVVAEHGRGQFNTPITYHSAGLGSYWSDNSYVQGCEMNSQYLYTTLLNPSVPSTTTGTAGINQAKAQKSQRNGIIKNFLSSGFSTETDVSLLKTAQTGTVQSSALVFNGPDFQTTENPKNFISYVWKAIDGAYKHFGTRLRIVGKIESAGDRSQSPVGGMTYYNIPGIDPTQTVSIGGGSAGIGIVNPNTNNGYFFEIAALTSSNVQSYLKTGTASEIAIDNIMFYKIEKSATSTEAIPKKLWGANGNILVDDGNFVGQYRFVGEDNPTVYDLSIEYIDLNDTSRVFYLYINQKLVAIVPDANPLPFVNPSIALFVRGTSKAMFENIYALSKNYSNNSVFDLNTPLASIFGDNNNSVNATEALSKYAMSGVVQKTYLSGINPSTAKDYNMYFEEFGTIMRECSYFNIKYDRAYPALYANIAPTFTRLKGYTVSGFNASSYGAEFLIFNNTDTMLNLDETTGNYLRILGVAFTQDTTQTLTVDDYFKKKGNLLNSVLNGTTAISSPYKIQEDYDKIKTSRIQYGKNEFTLASDYIQDQDTAEEILGWIIQKNLKPRKAIGLKIFPIPTLQLGDLVNINYKANSGVDMIVSESTRLVVYNIEYSKSQNGPSMTIYLSEV